MHLFLQEQLRRWTESETNKQNPTLEHRQNVKFHVSAFDVCTAASCSVQDSDIFMSACMSGDENEVEQLLRKGASVDTAAMDGLTALHQVCVVVLFCCNLIFFKYKANYL
jgi:protein phosphatase 1 regulatory subunit 12A